MQAAKNGHLEVVRVLLQHGANANETKRGGITALMFACIGNHEEVMCELLQGGAEVNAKSISGHTALIWAARYGRTGSVSLLLDSGAQIHVRTNNGRNAAWYAQAYQHTETYELLKRCGAIVNFDLPRAVDYIPKSNNTVSCRYDMEASRVVHAERVNQNVRVCHAHLLSVFACFLHQIASFLRFVDGYKNIVCVLTYIIILLALCLCHLPGHRMPIITGYLLTTIIICGLYLRRSH